MMPTRRLLIAAAAIACLDVARAFTDPEEGAAAVSHVGSDIPGAVMTRGHGDAALARSFVMIVIGAQRGL